MLSDDFSLNNFITDNECSKSFDFSKDLLRHVEPVVGYRRARYGNNLWLVYSPKIDRKVKLYSNLEYFNWIMVEATPEIVAFCEQPVKIVCYIDGRNVVSIIDMWVKYYTGIEEYREIKYVKELKKTNKKPMLHRKMEAQKNWCSRQNVDYRIITDIDILANELLIRNWRVILTHISNNTKNASILNTQKQIINIVNNEKKISLSMLVNRFSDISVSDVHTAVFWLLHSGRLIAPLHETELSNNIILKLRNNL